MNQICQYGKILFSKAPDFIVTTCWLLDISGSVSTVSASMQTHYRAEDSILEPSNNQFSELITFNIATIETTDIRIPPWNTTHSHIQS